MSTAAAIIVAGGPGTRLGAAVPKAFVELGGVPLFLHSLRALLRAPSVISAVVVVPSADLARAQSIIDVHAPWRCPVIVTAGGAERQDSVRCGLAHVGAAEIVAIHDAARPFVRPETVEEAIRCAAANGAAVVAVAATDTIKQVNAEGWIESTPPRQHLWLAQTPQVFRSELIRAAHAGAAGSSAATDDAMLVERLGARVYVVSGSADNRKITTPEDLRWAEWMLAGSPASR